MPDRLVAPVFDVDSSDNPIDTYLPQNGNRGYRVSRYELDLEYKVESNRLTGKAKITAVTMTPAKSRSTDHDSLIAMEATTLPSSVNPYAARTKA